MPSVNPPEFIRDAIVGREREGSNGGNSSRGNTGIFPVDWGDVSISHTSPRLADSITVGLQRVQSVENVVEMHATLFGLGVRLLGSVVSCAAAVVCLTNGATDSHRRRVQAPLLLLLLLIRFVSQLVYCTSIHQEWIPSTHW
jgi:hypothetical protein